MERYNQFRTRDGYHIDFISPESVTVYTDKSKFLQAFYNIVNNAITYTGADKRVVLVRMSMPRRTAKNGSGSPSPTPEREFRRTSWRLFGTATTRSIPHISAPRREPVSDF